jgi:alpha-amylase
VTIKDRDIADWLIYDSIPRSSLIDRFFSNRVTLEEYRRNTYEERGDFAGRPYNCRVMPGVDALQVNLERAGMILSSLGPCGITLGKSIALANNDGRLYVNYGFANTGDTVIDTLFACECNINLLGGGHNEAAYYRIEGRDIEDTHLDSSGEITDVARLIMGNRCLGIELELELDRPLTVWRYPVESVSNSEGGLEKVYQCSCVTILLPLNIGPGQAASFSYSWRVVK